MNFGEQIKDIRKSKNLTQEQFATKLSVSRQAISNWENNKNLPDIEMLILISDIYEVSLDRLIKGDDMNNMTKKVIRDGSETRRARYNMITSIISAILILVGITLIIIKGFSVEYVDAEGFLHENFFLLPMGFFAMFCGVIGFVSIGIRTIIAILSKK